MMETNADWVVVFRALGIAELMLILGLTLKAKEQSLLLRLIQLFVTCTICYLLSEIYRPPSISIQPPFVWYALIFIAMAIPALCWLIARVIFVDDFRWGKLEGWVVGPYQLSSALFLIADYVWKFELGREHAGILALPVVLMIGLVLWTLFIVIESWRIDLVEHRRRLRLLAVSIVGGYTLLSLTVELSGINSARNDAIMLFHTFAIAALGFVALLVFGQISTESFQLPNRLQPELPTIDTTAPKSEEIEDSSRLIPDWEKHLAMIRDQRLYALENMTISKLADLLSVPEYRLRKQIVTTTPFKNFNQFLNHFRIEEAASRLRSDDQKHLPILTIALDVGFRSLPSFNRSFKDQFAMTPSEYRKTCGV